MRIKTALVASLFLAAPVVAHAATYPAIQYQCGSDYTVTWLYQNGAIALNGTLMDNYFMEQSKSILFAEYAMAGGSRTQYELRTMTNRGVPAIRHQWLDADDNPKGKTKVVYCEHPIQVQAEEPEASMLTRLAEDAEG